MTSRCEYCGRELPTKSFTPFGSKPVTVAMPCDCERARAAAEEEDRRVEQEERLRAFSRVWSRSGVPKRFLHVSADFGRARPLFDGESMYLVGDNGRGKTHAACQAAKAYLVRNTRRDEFVERGVTKRGSMRCGVSFKFVAAQDMFSELRSSYDRWDQNESEVLARWEGVDLLVLDDLGKGVPSEWAAETLFKIVNRRWSDGRLTIVTSQYGPSELADRYRKAGDETMGAMLSRIQGDCVEIRLGGPDRRIEGARMSNA